MNKIFFLLLILILASCGHKNNIIPFKTKPCHVVDAVDGAKVVCPDGSEQYIEDGKDGVSAVFDMTTVTTCSNGGVTLFMALDTNSNGLLDLTDTNLNSTTICNGNNAPVSPFTPVSLIDPCGDASGKFDEVLLKFSNGQIMASFSDSVNGLNTRFSLLTAGNYMTTDGTSCHFSVDGSGTVTW